jgi:hypothetical protein
MKIMKNQKIKFEEIRDLLQRLKSFGVAHTQSRETDFNLNPTCQICSVKKPKIAKN